MSSDFILRVLSVFSIAHKPDLSGDLQWRTDGEYAPVRFFTGCNDIFYWGCADAEEISSDADIDLLEAAIADCEAVRKHGGSWAALLYCARKRSTRPQDAAYNKLIPRCFWPLFDAAGPERENDIGNPEEREALNSEQLQEVKG